MLLKIDEIDMENYQRNLLCDFDKKHSFIGKKVLEIGSDLECKTALGILALGAKEVWAVNPLFHENFVSPDPRIHVIKSLGEKTKLKNNSFDIIFGIALLEHVLHPETLFYECKRLLKRGGVCYLQGNPLWTCYRGHHIWCEKFKFGDETNPLLPWEHLCYKNYDEMHEALSKRGYCENDIKEIYNEVYVTDDRSRIYPSEIKKIAKHIRSMDVEIEQYSSNVLPNQYYEIAKSFISEEDLMTDSLGIYFIKHNIIKKLIQSLFSIKNKNNHKIFQICGIKLKFKLKKKRILIVHPDTSNYSFGDQAMIVGLMSFIKKKYPKTKLDSLYLYPRQSDRVLEDYGLDVKEYSPESYECWEKYIKGVINNYNTIIVIGADILDGAYGIDNSLNYLRIIKEANNIGKNVIVNGCSFNSIKTDIIIKAIQNLPKGVIFNARDINSYNRLKSYGCKNLKLTADTAFLFNYGDYNISSFAKDLYNKLCEIKKKGKKLIGIHLCLEPDFDYQTFVDKLTDTIPKDCYYILFPHDLRVYDSKIPDKECIELIEKSLKSKGIDCCNAFSFKNEADVKFVMRIFDLVITGRMHPAIAALSLDIPVISFVYQDKFEGLYSFYKFKQNYLFDKKSFDSVKLKNIIDYSLKNIKKVKTHINKKNKHIKRLAEKNIQAL